MARLQRVEIEWIDSTLHEAGWRPVDEFKEHRHPHMLSIGYILTDDAEGVTLVGDVHPEFVRASRVVSIPTGCIIGRRNLR